MIEQANAQHVFSVAYTFLIVFSISMSPTGMRTPPSTARTAPMTAPVMSPQFRLQPIFLVSVKNRGGALVPHQRPGMITVFSACPDSAIRTLSLSRSLRSSTERSKYKESMPPEQIILPTNEKQIFFAWLTKLVFYAFLSFLAPKIPLEAENIKETAVFSLSNFSVLKFPPWVINILLSYLSRTMCTYSWCPAPSHPTIGCSFSLSLAYLHSAPKQNCNHSDRDPPENQTWLA